MTTGWVSVALWCTLLAIVTAGDLGTSATLDVKIEQAQDASGTGAKDVSGKAITQLTEAGGDSNKQALINLRAEEMDVEGGFTHVRLSMTIATAASDAAAVLLGLDARYAPASDNDATTVGEIVA